MDSSDQKARHQRTLQVFLNPIEKLALGREHKVAKWFTDGATELVSEIPIRPLAELKSIGGGDCVHPTVDPEPNSAKAS